MKDDKPKYYSPKAQRRTQEEFDCFNRFGDSKRCSNCRYYTYDSCRHPGRKRRVQIRCACMSVCDEWRAAR